MKVSLNVGLIVVVAVFTLTDGQAHACNAASQTYDLLIGRAKSSDDSWFLTGSVRRSGDGVCLWHRFDAVRRTVESEEVERRPLFEKRLLRSGSFPLECDCDERCRARASRKRMPKVSKVLNAARRKEPFAEVRRLKPVGDRFTVELEHVYSPESMTRLTTAWIVIRWPNGGMQVHTGPEGSCMQHYDRRLSPRELGWSFFLEADEKTLVANRMCDVSDSEWHTHEVIDSTVIRLRAECSTPSPDPSCVIPKNTCRVSTDDKVDALLVYSSCSEVEDLLANTKVEHARWPPRGVDIPEARRILDELERCAQSCTDSDTASRP